MIAIISHHLSEFEGCAATVVSPILVSLRGERDFLDTTCGQTSWLKLVTQARGLTLQQLVKFRLNIASNRQLRGQRETKPKVGGGK